MIDGVKADAGITERIAHCVALLGGQHSAARAVGVTQSGLRKWVTGEARAPLEAIMRLADLAGVTVQWVATGYDGGLAIHRFAPDAFGLPVRQPFDVDTLNVHHDFFALHRLDANKSGIVRVVGDAMTTELPDGSLVIVDMRLSTFTDEGLWVLGRPGAVLIRRASFEGDRVRLAAQQQAYKDIVVSVREEMEFKIWGRVSLVLSRR